MNERDKELAMQAGFNPFDTECYEGLDVLIDLIRSDEREAILKLADSLGWVNVDDIRARGTT